MLMPHLTRHWLNVVSFVVIRGRHGRCTILGTWGRKPLDLAFD
jgi:hypothetical protein